MLAGKPEVIANAEGNRTTPSVVAVNKSGDRLVGQVAQRQRVTNPKNTIYGVKRLIGRKWGDKEVQNDHDIMPFEIVKKGDGVAVKLGDKEYTPEAVSAMMLVRSLALRLSALLTSQPQLPWLTALRVIRTRRLPSLTLVVVHLMCLFWNWVMAYLRFAQPMVTPTLVVRTLITVSSTSS